MQPSARLFYRASPAFAAWASVSRAVKTPLLINREMIANVMLMKSVPGFPTPIPVLATFYGSSKAQSEVVKAYEAGFRGQFAKGWSYDVAIFYNDYDRLSTGNLIGSTPIMAPPIPFPVGVQMNYSVGNSATGNSRGAEVTISGAATSWWKLDLSYSFLDLYVSAAPGTYALIGDGNSPRHQVRLNSKMNLSERFSLNTQLQYIGETKNGNRPAYTDLDIRAIYVVNPRIELSVVGSNLLKKRRLDYWQDTLPLELVYVPRSALFETRVRF